MKLKIITIMTLIFLATMALGAVSASENITQGTEEMLEIADDSSFEIEQSVQEDLLGESEYTFTELNDKLNLNGSGTIILDGDYSYNNGSSTDGINISRELTIDGDGHKIDGKSKSKIFNIMEDNVVLKNIIFVNANGGAISINANNVTISNCKFINCSSTERGGAISMFMYSCYCTIENCSFTDNKATDEGGAIYITANAIGEVINCNFTNNKVTADNSYGGAVYFGNNTMGGVTNCNFINNKADGEESYGGAVYFGNDGNVTDCTFVNNSALEGCGGAICFGNDGNVTNCNFMNNSAGYTGGAVHFELNSTGDVTDCNFTDNTAANNGGAIYMGNGIVTNCNFIGNNATDYGGAIDMEEGNVSNCNFTNNTVDTDGGAVRMYSGTVIYCTFINNKVNDGRGGAVYFYESGNVTNCNFVNNAGYMGGAVYFDNDGNVTNCNFTDNKVTGSDSFGGAVYFYGSGNVKNCNFKDNTADDGFGGAVYFNTNGNVTNCNFVNNSAWEVGAVYFNTNGNVVDCNFTNNKATATSSGGGAIYFGRYSDCSVINCNFVNNTAKFEGGAVYFDEDSTCTVTDCNFTGNNATDYGGAVYFWSTGNVTNCNFINNSAGKAGAIYFAENGAVVNCNFTNCTSENEGGAVYFTSNGEVTNCTFTDNSAWAAGAIYFGNNGNVKDCTFTDNSASGTGAIYFGNNGNVKDCSFTGNTASSESGAVYFTSNGEVTNCNFVNNSAYEWGGAIWMNSGNVTNCNFVNNSADKCGAVCINENGNVADCNFTNNKATVTLSWGGAIYFGPDSNGSVINCKFVNNSAVQSGGAVHFDPSSTGNVTNCSFTGNTASDGGAICYEDSTGNVAGCNFMNNSAGDGGGAICFYLNSEGSVTNCNFTGNTATYGGAVYYHVNGNVTNCNFTGNNATYYGGAIDMESGNVSNCNFIDNTAYENGGAIRMYSGNVTGCNFKGNTAVENGGAILSIICSEVRSSRFLYNRANLGSAIYNFNYEDCVFISNSEPQVYLDEEMRKKATMTIDVGDIFAKQDQNVIINLSGGISANVTAMLNGTVMSVEIINGTGILNLSGLDVGTYNLIVVFNGTFEYNPTSVNVTFSVLKSNSTAIIDVDDIYFGDDAVIVVTVPIGATGHVAIRVDEKLNYDITIEDGRASISIPGLEIGNYLIRVSYDGDSNFNASQNETSFEVKKNTFTRLQELIAGASDSLILDRDYYGDGSDIIISKTIIIDGKGHVLDAEGLSGIFYISASDVVINNLTFANGNSSSMGGSINIGNHSSATIANCSFINSTANYAGGAIYILYSSTILNCNFTNSSAANAGGAIAVEGTIDISGCSFTDSYANLGGAIALGDSANVDNCSFTGNAAKSGGAIYFNGDDCAISNSVFEYCSATDGGAIYANGKARVKDSLFSHNDASNLGGAIYNCNYVDCVFDSNTEPEIYFDEEMRKIVNMTVEVPENIMAGDEIIVNITISPDINASLTVMIDGLNKSISLVNGTGILHLANMSAGNHELTAVFNGTYEYAACNSSVMFHVSKYASVLDITKTDRNSNIIMDDEFVYGSEFFIAVTNNTYPVIVTINGVEYPVSEGRVLVNTATLAADEYTVIARIPESFMYNASEKTMTFTIIKKSMVATIETSDIFVDQNEIVTVTFNENITCNVTVQISLVRVQLPSGNESVFVIPVNNSQSDEFRINRTVEIVNGRGILNVSNLASGNYTATVYFNGNENYWPANDSSNFTVSKYYTILNINVDDIHVGEYPVVNIVFSEDITGNVTIQVQPEGGIIWSSFSTMVENGKANFTIPYVTINQTSSDFIAGDYIVAVNFTDNELYDAVYAIYAFTASKYDLNVSVDFNNNDKTITITPASDITGNLTFVVDGKSYFVDSLGRTIDLSGLASGSYTYTLSYGGDGRYNNYSTSANITLTRMVAVMTVNVSDIYYGETENVGVTLPSDATGDVIFVLLDNESSVILNTTSGIVSGMVSLQIPNLAVGEYVLNVRYSGSNAFESAEDSTYFIVSKYDLNVSVIFSNEDKTITVTPASDITGNLTFVVDGKSYFVDSLGRTIDLSGLASGSYTYTLSYGGDGRYNNYSTSANITLTRKVAVMTVHVSDIYYDQTENVEVTLPSDATGDVIFVLLDNESSVILNTTSGIVSGMVSLQIPNLNVGNYVLNVRYSGSNAFESAENSTYFIVSKYDLNVSVVFSNEDKTITITPASDITGNLTFIVGDKSYFVDSQGRIIDLSGLASGSYTYALSYGGDGRYNNYSTSANITLTRMVAVMTVHVSDIKYGQIENVEVTLPSDATGDVRFILMDDESGILLNTTTSDIVGGKVSLQIPNLSAGNYVLNVRYSGSNAFESAENSTYFIVSKYDLNVNVDFKNDEKIITVTPNSDITYNVRFIIANSEYLVGSQGRTINLSNLENGNYTYTITYSGDDKYNSYSSIANITLSRISVNVTVEVENMTYGETQEVLAVVPDGATSEVNFVLTKDEEVIMDENSPVINGIASVMLPQQLDAGTYTLKASYVGDPVYEKSSFYEKSFTVAPSIDISPNVKIGDDGKIVIEVGNIKGEITVYVDDVKDGSRGIKGKNFTYYLPTDEYSVGYHNLTFEYAGSDLDENVFKEWDNETQQYVPVKYQIYITQRPTEAAPDSDSDQKFTLVLEDDDGTLLSNATGDVVFTIMDEFANVIGVEVVKIVDGIASLDISKYKNGNYVISWSYSGDEKHTPISRQVRLSIEHKASNIIAGDLKLLYTQSKWYSVTVYGNDGKPLANTKIEFFAGSQLIATATTNPNGVAGVSISHIPGTYSLTIKAPGKTVVKKLTVDHLLTLKSVNVKRAAKKLVLTATLKKVNGKYLKGKVISFKFNGKKMSAKTNSKGVAKVTVKKNILKKLKKGKKVTYQATYLKDTVKKTAKIK